MTARWATTTKSPAITTKTLLNPFPYEYTQSNIK